MEVPHFFELGKSMTHIIIVEDMWREREQVFDTSSVSLNVSVSTAPVLRPGGGE